VLAEFDILTDWQVYQSFIKRIGIVHMHVHHVIDLPNYFIDIIPGLCTQASITYDVSIHDYMLACPRVFMTRGDGIYCGEPPVSECDRCVALLGSVHPVESVVNWRERSRYLLAQARSCFVPTDDVAARLSRYFSGTRFLVRPHHEPSRSTDSLMAAASWRRTNKMPTDGRRHVVILGGLQPHKGESILSEVAELAQRIEAPIRFTIVGTAQNIERLNRVGNVRIHGKYDAPELMTILKSLHPDFIFISSTCPETYSFTLTEAMTAGVMPVAFDIGAIAQRIRAIEWGYLLPQSAMRDAWAVLQELLAIEPTAPPEAVYDLARKGFDYDDIIRDYYDLRWEIDSRARSDLSGS
jgi:hypothetical protein